MGRGDSARGKCFFLNGNLHKIMHVARSKDEVTTYDFVEGKTKVYNYSSIKKKAQKAFTITEAAEMVGRHRDRIVQYISNDMIETPQREYRISDKKPWRYFFSEDDMMDLHSFMAEIHHGRPRNDGKVTNNRLPPRDVFEAMVRSGGKMLYIEEDGEFKPVWRRDEW